MPTQYTVCVRGLKLHSSNDTLRNASMCARMAQAKRARVHREAVGFALAGRYGHRPPALPVTVEIVRIAPRELDDDNLVSSAKHVRDGVAEWLRTNDRDKRITWRYTQRHEGSVLGFEVNVTTNY